jgi:hypothetical protein
MPSVITAVKPVNLSSTDAILCSKLCQIGSYLILTWKNCTIMTPLLKLWLENAKVLKRHHKAIIGRGMAIFKLQLTLRSLGL